MPPHIVNREVDTACDTSALEPEVYSLTKCYRGCCQSSSIRLDIPKADVRLQRELAQGSESVVYHGQYAGVAVAAKKPRLATSDDMDRFHKELRLLTTLNHPNMVNLIGARAQPPDYLMVFPLYNRGNLADNLHKEPWRPASSSIVRLARQLASVGEYLHGKGIIHRDIKPANVLLDQQLNGHLADFGLAENAANLKHFSTGWTSRGKPTGGFHKQNMVGTLQYMAPEVLRKEAPTAKSDVYSFAITINEVCTGVPPYSDRFTAAQAHTVLEMDYSEQQLAAAIVSEGLRPVLPGPDSAAPPRLAALIERCWHADPDQRPSFSEVGREVDAIAGELVGVEWGDESGRAQRGGDEAGSVGEEAGRGGDEAASAWAVGVDLDEGTRNGEGTIVGNGHLGGAGVRGVIMNGGEDEVLVSGAGDRLCGDGRVGLGIGGAHAEQSRPSWAGEAAGGGYAAVVCSGVFETRGAREKMEDRHVRVERLGGVEGAHLFAVLDGHRGYEAAEFCRLAIPQYLEAGLSTMSPTEALRASFIEADTALQAELDARRDQRKGGGLDWNPGCTATAALLLGDRLLMANAGDCRAILCRDGKAMQLTKDHVAADPVERQRVEEAGGQVQWRLDTWRVGKAAIQVTRSLGDVDLKPAVTAEPEITEYRLTPSDEFLVLASDGLWDVVSNEEVVQFVYDTVKEPSMVAKRLATEAITTRFSGDNLTVTVVFLKPVTTCERVY